MMRKLLQSRLLPHPHSRWKSVYQSQLFIWNGSLQGPCCAAYGPNGEVMISGLAESDGYIFFTDSEFVRSPLSKQVEVCLTEALASAMGRSCLVFADNCSLNDIHWCVFSSGVPSPFGYARALRILLTGRKCVVKPFIVVR